jgi:hypothetical protein
VTAHLLDIASYQGTLSLADVARAGFTSVNLKISHGLGTTHVHPNVATYAATARERGMGICTFHYLTTEGSGEAQAEWAFARIVGLGLQYGTAHQLDVESSPVPTLATVRGYLTRMTELLKRPVALYTGDWWWTARPSWNVADLTPYLWAAPNAGSLGSYPGDTSANWLAGYGGWKILSIMQYAVGPLSFPGGTVGSIDVSKSAIRDSAVWRDLTQGRPGMSYAPDTLKAARTFYINTLAKAGYKIDPLSVGIVGDDSHASSGTSYHLGKDALKSTAYSIVESARDKNGLTDAAAAIDLGSFSITVKGKSHNLRTFSAWLVAQCKANTADTKDIREVIYSLDGTTVERWDRLGKRTTGDSSHLTHTHESWFRDSEGRDKTAHLRRYFTEIGVLEDEDVALTEAELDKIADRVWNLKLTGSTSPGPARNMLQNTFNEAQAAHATAQAVQAAVTALATSVGQVDEEVVAALAEAGRSDADVAAVLRAALGDRAAAVGQLLASS